jgi:hypothetical protein
MRLVFRHGLIAIATGYAIVIVFWTGWIMGHDHYHSQIERLLLRGESHEAALVLDQWCNNGGLNDKRYLKDAVLIAKAKDNAELVRKLEALIKE